MGLYSLIGACFQTGELELRPQKELTVTWAVVQWVFSYPWLLPVWGCGICGEGESPVVCVGASLRNPPRCFNSVNDSLEKATQEASLHCHFPKMKGAGGKGAGLDFEGFSFWPWRPLPVSPSHLSL